MILLFHQSYDMECVIFLDCINFNSGDLEAKLCIIEKNFDMCLTRYNGFTQRKRTSRMNLI